MIRSIYLRNFKKHENLDVAFSEGLNAVIGGNASGKTSIYSAALFALFGPGATGHRANRIPTRGATDPTTVTLDIEIPVHGRIRIERTLKGAKMTSLDGTLLANGATPCVKLLEEAYGMSASDLQTLMYSRQGQSQLFLEMGASILQQTVERLAKSDLVDKVLGMVGKDVTAAEGRIAGLGTPDDTAELQRKLQAATVAAQAHKASLDDVAVNIQKASELEGHSRRQYEEAVQTIKRQEAIRVDLGTVREMIRDLEAEIQEQNTTLEGYGDDLEQQAEVERSNIESLQTTWMARKQRVDTAVSLLDRIEKRKVSLDHYAEEIRQSEEVRGALLESEQEVSRLKDDYQTLKLAALQAQEDAAAARKAMEDGVCRECKRPFSEEEQKAAIERHDLAANRLQDAHHAWNNSLTPLKLAEEKLAKLKTLYKPGAEQAYLEVKTQMEDAEADLAAALSGFGSLEDLRVTTVLDKTSLDMANQRWRELTARANDRKNLLRHKALNEEQLSHARGNIEKLEADLLALPAVVADPETMKMTWLGATEHLSSLRDLEKSLIGYVAEAEADARVLASNLEHCQKVTAELQKLSKEVDQRKRLQVWLRKSRAELMTELWDNMLAYASHLISSTTDGLLAQVFREEGELFVVEEGYKMAVSELSGFQRSLVGLAIRIAMSRAFYGEDHFLLLDEPTSDANDENAARIAGMLQGLGSQVIYVTHREGDSVNAGTVISF